jgi:hypothetical protein
VDADTTDGRTGRQGGRWAVRAVAAVAVALLVLGATLGAAGASDNTRSPKQTFIKNCTDSGGSVQEYTGEMEGVVQCTHVKDGNVTTVGCEFTGPYLWVCGGSTQPDSHGTPIRRSPGLRTPAVSPGASLAIDDDEER